MTPQRIQTTNSRGHVNEGRDGSEAKTGKGGVKDSLREQYEEAFAVHDNHEACFTELGVAPQHAVICIDGNVLMRRMPKVVTSMDAMVGIMLITLKTVVATAKVTVVVFDELRATDFLKLAEPDVYVKGGDYTVDELPTEERAVVDALGGRIVVLAHVPGKSTSDIAARIGAG